MCGFKAMLCAAVLASVSLSSCTSDRQHGGPATDTAERSTDSDVIPDLSVPVSCDEAETFAIAGHASAVGCAFFAVSLDNYMYAYKFDVVLSNVHHEEPAKYTIYGNEWDETAKNGPWREIASGDIEPLTQRIVTLNRRHIYDEPQCETAQAVMPQGACRIVSDIPVVAYQFHPVTQLGTADASLLLPTHSWSEHCQVFGYRTVDTIQAGIHGTYGSIRLAYAAVVAQKVTVAQHIYRD